MFEYFIRNIKIENYIKNIKGRKVIIWGASENTGAVLYEVLKERNIIVDMFVDSKANNGSYKFNGIDVLSPNVLIGNKSDCYVFVAADYHEEIERLLKNQYYDEIKDYLYIFHKEILVEKDEMYMDKYGNEIKGIKGQKINFIGWNSKLTIGENCLIKGKIYCANGSINFKNGSTFKEKSNLICHSNSSINVGEDCIIYEASNIVCYINSSINIGEKSIVYSEANIRCYEDSNIKIGNKCGVGKNAQFFSFRNSNISIGESTTMEQSIFIEACYEGNVMIGDDCMISYFVQICVNDGHPIFDINMKQQINIKNYINIGNHVWIGRGATILSKSKIGDGSIVGASSVVTKKYPNNCTIAGNPSKVLRKDIAWDRCETNVNLIDETRFWDKTRG